MVSIAMYSEAEEVYGAQSSVKESSHHDSSDGDDDNDNQNETDQADYKLYTKVKKVKN